MVTAVDVAATVDVDATAVLVDTLPVVAVTVVVDAGTRVTTVVLLSVEEAGAGVLGRVNGCVVVSSARVVEAPVVEAPGVPGVDRVV